MDQLAQLNSYNETVISCYLNTQQGNHVCETFLAYNSIKHWINCMQNI